MQTHPMTSWKITGIIATAMIVLSIPLYLLTDEDLNPISRDRDTCVAAIIIDT